MRRMTVDISISANISIVSSDSLGDDNQFDTAVILMNTIGIGIHKC